MKTKAKVFIPVFMILLIAFLLRLSVLVEYGLDFSLVSDDEGYISSAIRLLKNGMLTFQYEHIPTVHLMPGEPLMLAAIFALFGVTKGVWAAKLVHILIGCATVGVAMLLSKRWVGEKGSWLVGLIGAVFPPIIQVDNLALTEGPYVLATLLLIYCSIRLTEKQNMLWLAWILLTYFIALYFRVNIALYPIVLFLYLWYKKYPKQLFIKQMLISVAALLIVMSPWWIRNYIAFDQFIPLTAGSGDPLLLGTFQGEGYPKGSYETSVEIADARAPEKDVPAQMNERKAEALKRMAQWWDNDPVSMIKSYCILKPWDYLKDAFYWKEVWGIGTNLIRPWYRMLLIGGVIGWFALGSCRAYRAEVMLIVGYIVMNIAMNSYYYAFPRYNYPLVYLWIIGFVFVLRIPWIGLRNKGRVTDGNERFVADHSRL